MKIDRMLLLLVVFVLLQAVVCVPQAGAQGLFGTISGTITDATGAVVPGATVTVTNVRTNVKVKFVTNASGNYSVSSLNPGIYRVEVSAKGFKNAVQDGIVLEVDGNPKVTM